MLIPSFWWAMWAIRSGHSPKMSDLSDVSESLRLLTKDERPWAIDSGRSLKMSDHERNAQVTHQKWAIEQISCFFKKRAIRSENRWANSQPCRTVITALFPPAQCRPRCGLTRLTGTTWWRRVTGWSWGAPPPATHTPAYDGVERWVTSLGI